MSSLMHKQKTNGSRNSYACLLLSGFIVLFILAGAEITLSSEELNKEKIISISFVTIDKGFRSGIKEQKIVIIKTEKEWQDLWRLHKGNFLAEQPFPGVDFKREMVIAVFSGEKKTGGYSVEIARIEENQLKLEVFYLETRPSPESIVAEVLTQPYHIVKLKKFDIPVVFIPRQLKREQPRVVPK